MAHKILTLENLNLDLSKLVSGKDVAITVEKDGLTAFSRLLKEHFDFIVIPETMEGLDATSLISALGVVKSPNKDSVIIFIGDGHSPENCYSFKSNEDLELHDLFELLLKGQEKVSRTTGFSLSPRGRLRKVLFVDDDKELHPLIQKGLKAIYNIESLICSSGKEALAKLLEFKPDLVILDVIMPELSGTELLTKIREIKETKNIPVIFFTAKEKVVELEELLGMGPIGLILKPVNPKTLSHEIQDIWNEN